VRGYRSGEVIVVGGLKNNSLNLSLRWGGKAKGGSDLTPCFWAWRGIFSRRGGRREREGNVGGPVLANVISFVANSDAGGQFECGHRGGRRDHKREYLV